MKTKFLVSLIAILAVMTLAISIVNAAKPISTFDELGIGTNFFMSINGIEMANTFWDNPISIEAGNTLPIRASFAEWGFDQVSDVKVKAILSTSKADITASTGSFVMLKGNAYTKVLSLQMPSDIDPSESLELTMRIQGTVNGETKTFEQIFPLIIQRQSYNADILSADSDKTVNAGESLAVNVVLKNRGYEELTDVFVVVSIPELGLSKKAYFEDLTANDTDDDSNKRDSAERTIYLRIPAGSKPGIYDMKVEAYNADTSSIQTSKIVILGSESISRVIAPVTSKGIASGTTEIYELVIVNSGNQVGIYEIVPETVSGLIVSADNAVITIPAGSSETVKLNVQASKEGTYSFAVNINSEGKLVQRVVLNANVTSKTFSGNVVLLTIILAIVFIVLLVVLVVLLTRKPKTEELEESYY